MVFLCTFGLYAVLMSVVVTVPLVATIFLALNIGARLVGRSFAPEIPVPGAIVVAVLMWLGAIGLVAPLKVTLMAAYFLLGRPAGGALETFAAGRDNAGLDAVVGFAALCGVSLWLVRDGIWRWRQASQVTNLPTSKVRSAAVGLVELRDVAQPASPGLGPILRIHWDMFHYLEPTQELRPFYLGDGTGRVLVDPRDCCIRAGWLADIGGVSGCHEIVLKRRVVRDDRWDSVTRTLMPGDHVTSSGPRCRIPRRRRTPSMPSVS